MIVSVDNPEGGQALRLEMSLIGGTLACGNAAIAGASFQETPRPATLPIFRFRPVKPSQTIGDPSRCYRDGNMSQQEQEPSFKEAAEFLKNLNKGLLGHSATWLDYFVNVRVFPTAFLHLAQIGTVLLFNYIEALPLPVWLFPLAALGLAVSIPALWYRGVRVPGFATACATFCTATAVVLHLPPPAQAGLTIAPYLLIVLTSTRRYPSAYGLGPSLLYSILLLMALPDGELSSWGLMTSVCIIIICLWYFIRHHYFAHIAYILFLVDLIARRWDTYSVRIVAFGLIFILLFYYCRVVLSRDNSHLANFAYLTIACWLINSVSTSLFVPALLSQASSLPEMVQFWIGEMFWLLPLVVFFAWIWAYWGRYLLVSILGWTQISTLLTLFGFGVFFDKYNFDILFLGFATAFTAMLMLVVVFNPQRRNPTFGIITISVLLYFAIALYRASSHWNKMVVQYIGGQPREALENPGLPPFLRFQWNSGSLLWTLTLGASAAILAIALLGCGRDQPEMPWWRGIARPRSVVLVRRIWRLISGSIETTTLVGSLPDVYSRLMKTCSLLKTENKAVTMQDIMFIGIMIVTVWTVEVNLDSIYAFSYSLHIKSFFDNFTTFHVDQLMEPEELPFVDLIAWTVSGIAIYVSGVIVSEILLIYLGTVFLIIPVVNVFLVGFYLRPIGEGLFVAGMALVFCSAARRWHQATFGGV